MSNNFKYFLETLYNHKLLHKFYEEAKNANVFYFDMTQVKNHTDQANLELEINMPFKNCWLEAYRTDCLFSYRPYEYPIYVEGIYVDEVAPNDYVFLILVNNSSNNQREILIANKNIKYKPMENIYRMGLVIVEDFLYQLSTKIIKKHENKNKYKGFNPKTKKGFHINNVIIITNILRKSAEGKKYLEKHKCEYRFEVRGHWRRLESFNKMGKNRDNEYNVHGFTWVSEHIRGDENGVLIKKQRVLINN